MQRNLVVIPTYNERDNIVPLVSGILRHAPGAHILFVDDNSQDGTRAAIRELMAAHPGVIFLLERERKLGLGTAYVAGFKWGLERAYDAMIEMDADLSHRAEDLARLIETLREAPVVIGSRYVAGGATENWGLARRLISRVGSFYARMVLNVDIHDMTGGFNAWRHDVIRCIDPDTIRSEGYTFQIELKFRAHLAGYELRELPIVFIERRAGQSKMSTRIVFEAVLRVWELALRRRAIQRNLVRAS